MMKGYQPCGTFQGFQLRFQTTGYPVTASTPRNGVIIVDLSDLRVFGVRGGLRSRTRQQRASLDEGLSMNGEKTRPIPRNTFVTTPGFLI